MTSKLEAKLKSLPKTPGVYFHKNAKGEIIYIGKAARLNNRVRQYFQKSRTRDPKTDALVAEITDVDWIEVETELDALFLEAELIRRYLPPYNILLRDDKALSYVRIDLKSEHPTVSMERRPLDDGATYYGPYYSAYSVKKALKYLRKVFPFDWKKPTNLNKRASLDYHLGLSPGLEQGKTSLEKYRANLRQLARYLNGERKKIISEIEKSMQHAAKDKNFEEAAVLRNRMRALQGLNKQIIFSDREFMDISKDAGLSDLAEVLGLEKIPRRIEGYDISHMSGTDTVASMVVFMNGLPDKAAYRKFKMHVPGNDDFAHMREVMLRRIQHMPKSRLKLRLTQTDAQLGAAERRSESYMKYDERAAEDATQLSAVSANGISGYARKQVGAVRQSWGLPDLYLIDGGKGQLSSALEVLQHHDVRLPAIGLAKQFEEIVVSKNWPYISVNEPKIRALKGTLLETDDFWLINLPNESHVVKLLQRIRDESHRFAVSYHTVLKTKRSASSMLDDIPTIGPATRRKLLKTFGSYKGVEQARDFELEKVVGAKKAKILRQYLRANKKAI